MNRIYKLTVLLVFLLASQLSISQQYDYTDSWGDHGFTLQNEDNANVIINFSLSSFTLSDLEVDGEPLKTVGVPGIFLPNNEGAPDLAGTGRFVAIPQGASVSYKITASRSETLKGVNIAPAPRIPLDTDKGPLLYKKDQKIYSADSFYPAEPVKISETTKLRGVDVVMVGITPFQYNPVTKELIVYRDLKIELTIEGGNGHVGDDRLRSRWWDPIIMDAVLNPEVLPEIDYNKKSSSSKSPDYEYIIITPNDPVFLAWADTIKNWRTLQGIRTGIVTTTEIGGNTTTSIKNYINDAYNNWDFPPAAVLLLADYSTGTAGITSYLYTHPAGYPNYASDNYFADVTGDDLPEVVFARITGNNNAQFQVMVSKFLKNERNPPTDPLFYNKPITALGWQTVRWFQICSEVVGGFWKNVQGKNPVRVNAVYEGNPTTDAWSTATNTSQVLTYFGPAGLGYIPATPQELGGFSGGTAQGVINAINTGSFMLQHRDHGSYDGWGEPAFNSTSISSLTNVNNKLPFIFSINCQTGAFHNTSECFAEKFHRWTYGGQNSGALGLIAATEVSYSFVNDVYVWGLFDNLWTNFMPGYGTNPASRDVLPAFGNAAGKYFLYQSGWPYNTGDKQVTYRLFHHHGDAFMTVYTEVPQNLNVTHNAALIGGISSFNVTANAGSFIALTVNGEIIATANGTGSPVMMTIEPQIPGNDMIVTVTKQNYFRYSSTVTIIPPTGPYVAYENYTISDASGNNNGLADFGEEILLNMTLKNLGSVTANNVSTTLICTDPYLTLTDNNQLFGTIASGATSTINNAYIFSVAASIPDQHVFSFELQISGNSDDIWTSYFDITANAPLLEPAVSLIIDDLSGGNGNGRLDPGETAIVTAVVENNGHSLSPSATATLTSASPYITINTGNDALGQIAAGSSADAVFNITCSSSTPVGQSVDLAMVVDAGNYGFSHTYYTSVGLVLEDWETGDFTRFPWTFGGNANWTIANTGQYEGLYTAKSGVINHSQASELSVLLSVTSAGVITFYRKVSSESGYDYLRFYIDGVQQEAISGEVAWGQISFPVTAGVHTFKWGYSKDGSVVSGSDCAWVDYIVFPPSVVVAPEIVINPTSFTLTVAPDEIATTPLTISNTGNLNLTWSAITLVNSKEDKSKAYCTASGTCDEYISKVVFNTIDNSSACSQYADYTSISTTVTAGETYNITVTNGVVYTTDDLGVWIDWNQNEVFTDAGENVVCAYSNSGQGTYAITIPETALSGPTRMRIRIKYSGDDCGSSCGATTYGEVEDYTVIVEGANKWLNITPASGTITQGNNQNPAVTFDATGLAEGTYTGSITVNSNDSDEGQIVIPCTMIVANGFELNLTAMLEGPVEGAAMLTPLNLGGYLPIMQPYNMEPWNYTGTESVAVVPANVVDWVLVELRDATSPANATSATRIARQAAFILSDGSIVGLDGSSILQFTNSISQQLYAVVHHRNHLGILSASAIINSGGIYNYDFTTGYNKTYGGMNGCKEVTSGIWGMIGGDANCDGQILMTDMNTIWNPASGSAGYLPADFNLDGQVDNKDKDDCWAPNFGNGCQVPE